MSVFSERLKKLRQNHKYSQTEAAQAMGISRAMLSNYERGIREPDFQLLCKIACFYKTSTDYLLGHAEGLELVEDVLDVMSIRQINEMCISLSYESKNKLIEYIELLKLYDSQTEEKSQDAENKNISAPNETQSETRQLAIAKK